MFITIVLLTMPFSVCVEINLNDGLFIFLKICLHRISSVSSVWLQWIGKESTHTYTPIWYHLQGVNKPLNLNLEWKVQTHTHTTNTAASCVSTEGGVSALIISVSSVCVCVKKNILHNHLYKLHFTSSHPENELLHTLLLQQSNRSRYIKYIYKKTQWGRGVRERWCFMLWREKSRKARLSLHLRALTFLLLTQTTATGWTRRQTS